MRRWTEATGSDPKIGSVGVDGDGVERQSDTDRANDDPLDLEGK